MLNNVDLSSIGKKVLENPKLWIGTGFAAMAVLYALSRSVGGNAVNYDIDELPEYAKLDTDPEFTKFLLNKRRKHRKGSAAERNSSRRPKSSHNNNNNNTQHTGDQKELETDTNDPVSYSLFDPNNPNYSADLGRGDDDDDDEESDEEEIGFSTEQHYVPFRFKANKTQRKPDAPFVAILQMYASNSANSQHNFDHEQHGHGHGHRHEHQMMESKHEEDELEHDEPESVDVDLHVHDDAFHGVDSKMDAADADHEEVPDALEPFLSGMEQTQAAVPAKNALQSLKERYYKKQLPSSLQFDTLSKSFQSNQHQAHIQNDLEENDSFFEGIKQSVQMITNKNE